MELVVRNNLATAQGPIDGLSRHGGIIAAGVGVITSFIVGDEKALNQAVEKLDPLEGAGDLEYWVRAESDAPDKGGRLYVERFVIGHADLTEADTSQTLDDTYTFPTGAVLMGYRKKTNTTFSGGGVSALVADIGFDGAGLGDVLDDGQTVLTAGAHTFGAGANALPNARRDIGGQQIRAKIDSTDGNVAALTAGKLTIEVFFLVM